MSASGAWAVPLHRRTKTVTFLQDGESRKTDTISQSSSDLHSSRYDHTCNYSLVFPGIHPFLSKPSAKNIYYLTHSWNSQTTACITVITRQDNFARMSNHIKECSQQPSPKTLFPDSLSGCPTGLGLKSKVRQLCWPLRGGSRARERGVLCAT